MQRPKMKGKAKYGMYEKKIDIKRRKAGQGMRKEKRGWKGEKGRKEGKIKREDEGKKVGS